MKKKLKSSGNGWELYFSKPILKLLGYNPAEIKLLLTAKSKTLYIEPISPDDISKYENNMVRGLQKSGCSYGLYFPSPILEVLEIKPDTDFLEIDIDENKIKITKSD